MPAHGRKELAMAENREATKGSRRAGNAGRDDGHRKAREVEETHQANVNQVRDEPMPASQYDDPRQEAVVRNEEYAHDSEEAAES
jgi:hypothetical protein